jgi:hypothetical protein
VLAPVLAVYHPAILILLKKTEVHQEAARDLPRIQLHLRKLQDFNSREAE